MKFSMRKPEVPSYLAREAEYYAKTISDRLARLGLCHKIPAGKGVFDRGGVQKVRFIQARVTDDEIALQIDAAHLPFEVSTAQIKGYMDEICIACERLVHFRSSSELGAWLIVYRGQGVAGLPAELLFSQISQAWPLSSRKPLLVALGAGEHRKLLYRSVDDFPHALIGGATKSGKTTFLHGIICGWLQHYSPRQVQLILFDLKGGIEFTRYQGLPHVKYFIKDPAEFLDALGVVQQELTARLSDFERLGGIQDIAAWNYKRRGPHLARWVVIIDELAAVMLDPRLKKQGERVLADLAARGRAPGIHVILATQRPEVAVVSGLIKANLDARFAFRMTDQQSSMTILDDSEAARFNEKTPRGRYIYKMGLDRLEVQAPLITALQIDQIIRAVRGESKEDVSTAAQLPPEVVFRYALSQQGGNCAVEPLFAGLRGQGATLKYLDRLLRQYQGEMIEIDGKIYVLQAPDSVNRSRRLILHIEDENYELQASPPSEQKGPPHNEEPTIDNRYLILQVALTDLEGRLSTPALWEKLRGRVSKDWLRAELQALESQGIVEFEGKRYRVLSAVKPRIPRRLEEL